MSSKLIIHATNVHQGGGRTLLDALLGQAPGGPITAVLDSRMALAEGGQCEASISCASNLRRWHACVPSGGWPPIKRFCGNQELSLPLRDASEFMNYIVKKGRLSCES